MPSYLLQRNLQSKNQQARPDQKNKASKKQPEANHKDGQMDRARRVLAGSSHRVRFVLVCSHYVKSNEKAWNRKTKKGRIRKKWYSGHQLSRKSWSRSRKDLNGLSWTIMMSSNNKRRTTRIQRTKEANWVWNKKLICTCCSQLRSK